MTDASLINCEIDLDLDGCHSGFLRLPHSVHRSAYGWIPIPIVSVRNGAGPIVLLMAGVHGDEYEGQLALSKLSRYLQSEMIKGQVIVLPMANYPAAAAGLRTSPLDEGNLNRMFPGDPRGTPTQAIAHFIETVLLARADFLLDIHSGGSSLRYETTLLMAEHRIPEHQAKGLELLNSLGFSKAILFPDSVDGNYSSSAARRCGVVGITAEVAGGGNIDIQALKTLEDGLLCYLRKTGVLVSDLPVSEPAGPPRLFRLASDKSHVYAREEGLFEPLADIDDEVNTGQLAGYIHFPDAPWKSPEDVRFEMDAVVICRRFPARVERGDCLFELAEPI